MSAHSRRGSSSAAAISLSQAEDCGIRYDPRPVLIQSSSPTGRNLENGYSKSQVRISMHPESHVLGHHGRPPHPLPIGSTRSAAPLQYPVSKHRWRLTRRELPRFGLRGRAAGLGNSGRKRELSQRSTRKRKPSRRWWLRSVEIVLSSPLTARGTFSYALPGP